MNKIKVFTGDSYLIDQKIGDLKRTFINNNPNGVVENIEAETKQFAEIYELLNGTSLFWTSKFILIKNITQNKVLVDDIEQIFDNLPDDVTVIIREDSLDKRSKLYKLAKTGGQFALEDLAKPENIQAWIKGVVNENDGKIDQSAVAELTKRSGTDPKKLNYEIQKLLYFDKDITSENVKHLVDESFESSVFELVNAIFTQNKKRAMQIYERERKLGAEVPAIIGMLGWQIHLIACVKINTKPLADLARDLKTSPYSLSQTKNLSKNFDLERVRTLIDKVSELDYRTKTEQIDNDQAMKNLIVSL